MARPILRWSRFLRFLDALEVGFEFRLAGPGRAVHTLELSVVLVAAPVSAREFRQLERLTDVPRRRQVRPPAQVLPGALAINADRLVTRDVADDLGLVGLADAFEMGDGLVAVPHLAVDRLVAVDDLLHAQFDLGEVVEAERRLAGEIVIEAVFDVGADGDLGVGK